MHHAITHVSREHAFHAAVYAWIYFAPLCLMLAGFAARAFAFDASAAAMELETDDATIAVAVARDLFRAAAIHAHHAQVYMAYRARYGVPCDVQRVQAEQRAIAFRTQAVAILARATGVHR